MLYRSEEHHRRRETACLECLLSFDSQAAMAKAPFARRSAHKHLAAMLKQRPE